MFLDKNYFTKIVFYKKNLIVKKFLTGEFLWPKMISKKKNCLTENVFDQKLFWPIFFLLVFLIKCIFFNKNSMTRFWPIFFSFLKTFFQLVFSQQVFSTGCPREPYPLFFWVTVFNIFTLWSYHAIHMKTDIKRNATSTQSLLTEQ